MIDPTKLMETWLNMVGDAVRGDTDARDTIRSITGAGMRPDEMVRLMTRFAPAGVTPVQAEVFNEWLEEYWKTMGVVPRYRYLELLERYEQLRLRLDEAERANRQLSPMMAAAAQPEEAQRVLGMWGSMIEETLKAQQEWLKSWSTGSSTETEQQDQAQKSSGSGASTKK